MNVFLSYAREDRELAERVRSTFVAAGFDCFLDTTSLPPAQEFNDRIGRAIERADLFIVLLSAPALEPGSYVMTELAFAERKWRNPAGFVLPVATTDMDYSALPAYLAPISVFRPRGNVEAEILGWVRERVERGGGASDETPRDRLERWRRLHQPPLRRQRRFPARYIGAVIVGVFFIAFGALAATLSGDAGPVPGSEVVQLAFMVIPPLIGAALIVMAIVQSIRGVMGANPVAALVLDRSERKNSGVVVHLLLEGDQRREVTAIGRDAAAVYPGEIGWAFISSGMLLGFERG